MKKSLGIRILTALSGLLLVCTGIGALAERFFHVDFSGMAHTLLNADSMLAMLLTILLAVVLIVLGVSCLVMLLRPSGPKKRGFVMQKGENGAIGVSVRSIEALVQTCIRQHDIVSSAEVAILEKRDGIVILLSIQEAAGINIPLAVGALQKQIRQYVTTCTGVDVREVRVMVENTENEAQGSPYAVAAPVLLAAAEPAREQVVAELPEEAPVTEIVEDVPAEEDAAEETAVEEAAVETEAAPVAVAAPVVMPVIPEVEDEDDRPLHQRLFGTEEQPAIVPAPPELVVEAAAEEEEASVEAEEAAGTELEADQAEEPESVADEVEAAFADRAEEAGEDVLADEAEPLAVPEAAEEAFAEYDVPAEPDETDQH